MPTYFTQNSTISIAIKRLGQISLGTSVKVYQVPRLQIATQLTGLLNYKGFNQDNKALLCDALQRFADANVDIVDAILTAQTRGWRYFSFDQDLNKLANQD